MANKSREQPDFTPREQAAALRALAKVARGGHAAAPRRPHAVTLGVPQPPRFKFRFGGR